MVSFGTTLVDQNGFIDRFPGLSMLVGLLANAMGWDHTEVDKLSSLQNRLVYAARWDAAPEHLVDYHTADLGQTKMQDPFWTTQGVPERRAGGTAGHATHQRYRHYWADGLMTVVMGLSTDGEPTLSRIVSALRRPERPLFWGRKTCLPARPLLDPESPVAEGVDVLDILAKVEIWDRSGTPARDNAPREACWPLELSGGTVRQISDTRDWANQLVTGSRGRREGLVGRAE